MRRKGTEIIADGHGEFGNWRIRITALNQLFLLIFISMRWLLLLIFSFQCFAVFPQFNKRDSLRIALKTSQGTSLTDTYLEISNFYYRVDQDSMFYFAQQAHDLALKQNYKKGEAQSYLLMGISKRKQGDLTTALKLCQKSYEFSRTNNFREIEAEALNNIGLVYNYQGLYPTALEFYQKSFAIVEEIKSKKAMADVLNNLGGLYYNLKDYPLALDYWKRALELDLQLGDKNGAASRMNNIGFAYAGQGKYKMALSFYFASLRTYDSFAACGQVFPLEDIGRIYLKTKKLDSAEFYLLQALNKVKNCSDRALEIGILTGLADVYKAINKNEKALFYLENALTLGLKAGFNREAELAAKSLSELQEKLGHTKKALETFKIYQALQDSLFNNENAKAIGKLEAQYEYESAKNQQKASQRIEDLEKEKILTRQIWIRNTFIAGFVAMIMVALLVYRNFKRKKQSNIRLRLLNKEIKKQQKKLMSQSEQLKDLNKSLNELNSSLEHKIETRTQELNDKNAELENKNAKLANYAFLNAHKLRAPVATLLGLVMLFDNDKVDERERSEIVNKIRDCAGDLNNIVKELRIMLEMESINIDH
jgi:tetratricopeptide (TPR) repeat protein